jgi:hypothetical protein
MLLSKKNKTLLYTAGALLALVVLVAAGVRASKNTVGTFAERAIAELKNLFSFGA